MAKKRNVYLIDLGTGTDRNLLPLSIGLVGSYAMSVPEIVEEFDIKLIFLRDDPYKMVQKLEDPAVVAFSFYVWNLRASLTLAKLIKETYPSVLILGGGYSVPNHAHRIEEFFRENPFIDVLVHGEGELTFSNFLRQLLTDGNLSKVHGISFQSKDIQSGFFTNARQERINDLNILPSPFLNGVFDSLLERYRSHVTGVIWETNRGCPYSCTFCDWGNADVKKIYRFDLDRLNEELKWISRNQIFYIYGADANFGIYFDRDFQIASQLADLCKANGYPKYLMINWLKNSHEKIVSLADRLVQGGVMTNVTLAMQSMHPATLNAIKRRNIKTESFIELKKVFHDRYLPTYVEMILALPLENLTTFVDGLDQIMTRRLDDHFVIYLCAILENTEMADPEYRKTYQLESRHCGIGMSRRQFEKDGAEVEEIVVGTSTMPIPDWERAYLFGYFATVLFNHRVAFFIMNYLQQEFGTSHSDFINFVLHALNKGPTQFPQLASGLDHLTKQKQMILDEICSMSKPMGFEVALSPHEATLVILLCGIDQLYIELRELTLSYCRGKKIDISDETLDEIIKYQKARMPAWPTPKKEHFDFSTNLPKYFQALTCGDEPPAIKKSRMSMTVKIPSLLPKSRNEFASTLVRAGHTVNVFDVEIFENTTNLINIEGHKDEVSVENVYVKG